MGVETEVRTMVLHALRLKGVAEPAALAWTFGIAPDQVEAALADLAAASAVQRREGRFSGYSLSATGHKLLTDLLAAELDRHGLRSALTSCYRRFGEVNPELLEICTRWQLRPAAGCSAAPDARVDARIEARADARDARADADHDAAVIGQLTSFHQRAVPLLDDLADLLARYARYRPALEAALARLRSGDRDALTAPRAASYHTTWFELHEDLLATLGIDRVAEAPQPS
jgi:hypothetical protein